MARPKGRPKDNEDLWPRKITHKIELPEGLLSSLNVNRIKRARIIGAVITAVGTYMLAKLAIDSAKVAGKVVFQVLDPVMDFFSNVFKVGDPEAVPGFVEPKGLDPLAIGPALIAGGMVLAGLNPGEVLKGIGEILPL